MRNSRNSPPPRPQRLAPTAPAGMASRPWTLNSFLPKHAHATTSKSRKEVAPRISPRSWKGARAERISPSCCLFAASRSPGARRDHSQPSNLVRVSRDEALLGRKLQSDGVANKEVTESVPSYVSSSSTCRLRQNSFSRAPRLAFFILSTYSSHNCWRSSSSLREARSFAWSEVIITVSFG